MPVSVGDWPVAGALSLLSVPCMDVIGLKIEDQQHKPAPSPRGTASVAQASDTEWGHHQDMLSGPKSYGHEIGPCSLALQKSPNSRVNQNDYI